MRIELPIYSWLPLLLTGCAAMPNGESLRVDSEPQGAEIFVMGERVGTTPAEVSRRAIFPNVYPKEKEQLYGLVVLRKAGCQEFQTAVSAEKLKRGIDVKLKCEQPEGAGTPKEIRGRLKRLDELRSEGVISEEEYREQRRRILGEL